MEKLSLQQVLDIPYDQARRIISRFIKNIYEESNVDKAVIGLSGGVDSSTVLALLTESIGFENVVALIMPDPRVNVKEDVDDAVNLAKEYGVKHYLIDISSIVDSYKVAPFYDFDHKIATGNLRARIRMNLLYYYANKYNGLVVGTGDRSELLIGYYTKYGDGGVDILPIGCLYKTQVRRLAKILGLPPKIVEKPSSPGFWVGHLAEEEIGLKYEVIDLVLYALFDKGLKPDEASLYTGVSREMIDRVLEMHRRSRHKRVFPPIPSLPWINKVIYEI